jgi:hypothetical protein
MRVAAGVADVDYAGSTLPSFTRKGDIMSATYPIVGNGRHTFEIHEDWAHPPAGYEMLAASVTVDAQDRVY